MTAASAAGRRRCGFALLAGAVVLWIAARALFGPPAPVVRIVWAENAAASRRYLERRLGLGDGEQVTHGKWSYALRDTSESHRRRLVAHPSIAGIEGVDRRTLEIAGRLPRTAWRRGRVSVPETVAQAIEWSAVVLSVVALVLSMAPSGAAGSAARVSRVLAASRRWLQRGVPVASAESAAAFRIVFGALVVAFLVSEPVYPALLSPLQLAQASGAYGAVVQWFARHPQWVDSIRPVLALTGALFVAGAATRISFACFVASALAWAAVFTLNTSAHAIAAVVMTLLALLPARWADAWSIDAWVRRRKAPALLREPSRAYGYAAWAPGFVLAVAFAAAAWSKVHEGPGWILNGTVKYHFVSDLEQAWVRWGPELTRWPPVAVAMSAFAVVVEALLITAMFSASYAYRAALGALTLALLLGFALFQGIVWLGWWLMLLAFLPWHRIGTPANLGTTAAARGGLTRPQTAAVILVGAQQLVTTAVHMEARPMFSSYDMYSTTYATPEAYEAASNLVYRVVAVSRGETVDLPGCVVDDRVAAIARRALDGSASDQELLRHAIGRCLRDAPGVRQVTLEGDRQVFLWDEARFAWKRRLDVIGPIEAALVRE